MAQDEATDILPPGAPSGRIVAATAPEAPSLIGRSLGKFDVLEQLGRGGSGDVYRAEQPQLGRSAVIKVLRRTEGTVSPVRIDRFLREAKLASRLDHPYAAHVYAFGAEADGTMWIAMEHVRGATLDELIARRGPIPPLIFGPLFARLCEVVHTAHELGIVHRDIKGSNVMVIERAGQLLPKLIDLGIAKGGAPEVRAATEPPSPMPVAIGTADDSGHLTEHGATLGSPHYMSPEQWTDASTVDARADVYALGILAYRCVAGTVPFRFPDRATMIDAHLRRPPPPLPDRVPPPLAEAVMRALEKDPAARWQTAIAFGAAVQRAVGTAAQEAVPIFDPYTRDVWLRAGPQPIADAIAHVAAASTTVEADAMIRELVAITCRWLAVLALSALPVDATVPAVPSVRDGARGVVGRDDAGPWLELARVAVAAAGEDGAAGIPGLIAALAGSAELAALAARLDDRDRVRSAASLAEDVDAAASALRPIEPLLAYQLVVGRGGGAESWQGPRRRDRERVLVWGEPLGEGEVALLDATGRVVARLSPLAQVIAPLPSAEPELFLLWRSGRGPARLVAAPWGFERDDDAAGERLAALTTEDGDTAHDPADDVSPYPGLAAYGVGDAERFVGREREVEALANRLIRAPMIAVLGPSGAGKSSFIHAGVLPRLAEHYRVVTVRPGRHPMHALAALPDVSGESQDDGALAMRLRELGESASRGLLIVIDQLEEMVTLCGDPAERRRFADTLAAAADASSAPVRVIVTLRDDFAAVIESEASFRGRFEVFVLGTPLPEALRRIVVEPARRAAVAVDPAVVEDMVAEVAGRPASLPLLSFTAAQLWASRDRTARRITRDAYLAIGGVAGALSTYADQFYDALARRDQDVVRALFARLVAGDGTRIPAPRRELEQLPGAPAVLSHLIDARLLVVREDEGVQIVEIVHECLAERWDRLARWRREDATDRALVGDVRAAARRWLDTGRRPDALWRGEALAELRRLMGRGVALTDDERAFATAADLAAVRARRLRRGAVIAAIATLAVVAGVMAALGASARDNAAQARDSASHARDSETAARDAARLAEDRLTASLVAQGRVELNDGRELAALAYFAAALRRGDDSPGLRFMIAVASRGWRDELYVERRSGATAVDPLPDGGLAVAYRTGAIHFFDPEGKPSGELATGLDDLQYMRDDGTHLLAASRAQLLVLDRARAIVARVTAPSDVHTAGLGPGADEVTVVHDRGIAVYGFDGHLRREVPSARPTIETPPVFAAGHIFLSDHNVGTAIDLVTMKTHQVATDVHDGLIESPDGKMLGYRDGGGVVHIIAPDGTARLTIHPANTDAGVMFTPQSDRIVVASNRDASVYDTRGVLLRRYTLELGNLMEARGDDLWTSGDDGKIRHYRAGALVASLPAHANAASTLVLSGKLIASIGTDGGLVIDRADSAQLQVSPEPCAGFESVPAGAGEAYMCGDGSVRYYAGERFVATRTGDHAISGVVLDRDSGRAALASGVEGAGTLDVFDPTGAPLAHATVATGHVGTVAFATRDQLLVAEHAATGALWRWDLATGAWTKLADTPRATSVARAAIGTLVGFGDGKLRAIGAAGEPVHEVALGGSVDALAATSDGAWVVAQLGSGPAVLVDGKTGEVARRFENGDAGGVSPAFDDTGELLVRTARNTSTVWARATGDVLVFNLDILRTADGVRFAPGWRMELMGEHPGVYDVGHDTRAASALLHDIECKVPLEVRDGKLQPTTTPCPPHAP